MSFDPVINVSGCHYILYIYIYSLKVKFPDRPILDQDFTQGFPGLSPLPARVLTEF